MGISPEKVKTRGSAFKIIIIKDISCEFNTICAGQGVGSASSIDISDLGRRTWRPPRDSMCPLTWNGKDTGEGLGMGEP